MDIKLHRKQAQIGGNIIEISTSCTRILLDIGLDLNVENNHSLPIITGLFDVAGFDAVIVTHYHSDHMGLAYNVHPDIPLYMGEMCFKVIEASDQYLKKMTLSPTGFLQHKQSFKIKDTTITPFLCDHSAFDSYMILCETENESILYTGDFRGHGRKPYQWLLSELPRNVDVLICEGTTLSRNNYKSQTESQLENECMHLFKQHSGPIFVLQSSMNIDRLVTMYRAAKRSNRIFLQDLYLASITTAISGNIPNPSFNDVYVFRTTYKRHTQHLTYPRRIGIKGISKQHFVMCVRTSMLRYLKSLSKQMPFHDGLLIYSLWEGYKDTLEMQTFLNECKALGLTIVSCHTSGHADENAINQLISHCNPKRIIPVHTLNPEWFEILYFSFI
jgi:ribonuclease J